MVALMDAIARAMGWILRSLYEATTNYGLAIILFTVFIVYDSKCAKAYYVFSCYRQLSKSFIINKEKAYE